MSKTAIIASFLGVACVGLLAWAIVTMNALNQVNAKLSAAETQLVQTTTELENTRTELASATDELNTTKTELASAKTELTQKEEELAGAQDELSGVRTELAATNSKLSATRAELTDANTKLTDAWEQLDVAEETLKGLGITLLSSRQCYDSDLEDNPQSVNSTWADVKEFLYEDQTDEHPYVVNVYDCSEFSRDVHNNAEAAGIRAAEVHIEWSDGSVGHALNAFLTSDLGLVFTDSTGSPDLVARIEAGKKYRGVELPRVNSGNIRDDRWWDSLGSYYYISGDTGGEAVISSIKIYW